MIGIDLQTFYWIIWDNDIVLKISLILSELKNTDIYTYIAFEVDNVGDILKKALDNGTTTWGEVIGNEIEGIGILTRYRGKYFEYSSAKLRIGVEI